MANWDQQLVTPTLIQAPTALSGTGPGTAPTMAGLTGSVEPHHSVIAIVAFAAVAIFLLDRAGFRFAVTTGKR